MTLEGGRQSVDAFVLSSPQGNSISPTRSVGRIPTECDPLHSVGMQRSVEKTPATVCRIP